MHNSPRQETILVNMQVYLICQIQMVYVQVLLAYKTNKVELLVLTPPAAQNQSAQAFE